MTTIKKITIKKALPMLVLICEVNKLNPKNLKEFDKAIKIYSSMLN